MSTRREWIAGAAGWMLAAGGRGAVPTAAQPPRAVPDVSENGAGGPSPLASGRRAAVATVHPRATAAAIETLRRGGNAADAAVAAGLMLSVVDGHNSGLGGGCFILARSAGGQITAIDGREEAPAAASGKMFFRNGKPDPTLSKTGPLASGVPGAVAAYHRLSKRLGNGRWGDAVREAADVAENGFLLPGQYARRLASVADELRRFEASRAIFLRPDGSPLKAGDRLVQRDLAQTLRELADGPDAFYRGRFAERTGRWMRRHGGLITAADLAGYETRIRHPVKSTFRGHRVVGFPPPSSGGVHVAQILGMLERFDLRRLAAERPVTLWHVVAEAMRRAFADRARWLGDSDFADVPRGLLDAEYLQTRGASIDPAGVSTAIEAGAPPDATTRLFGDRSRHTTHLTVADRDGNWVAITATINTTLGSKVVVPGTGVVLNNEMDDFAIAPGVPNAFGLIGREANAPEPGKRPLSSMSPTLVLDGDEPVLTCGAAGGPRIISAAMQIVLRVIGLGDDVASALAAPRIHHQWRPDTLFAERRHDDAIVRGLRDRGHDVEVLEGIGTAQAIARGGNGEFTAAAEPRVGGSAAAL